MVDDPKRPERRPVGAMDGHNQSFDDRGLSRLEVAEHSGWSRDENRRVPIQAQAARAEIAWRGPTNKGGEGARQRIPAEDGLALVVLRQYAQTRGARATQRQRDFKKPLDGARWIGSHER